MAQSSCTKEGGKPQEEFSSNDEGDEEETLIKYLKQQYRHQKDFQEAKFGTRH